MGDRDDVGTQERMTRVVAATVGAAGVLYLVLTTPSIQAQFHIGAWWFEAFAVAMAAPALVLAVGAFRLPLRSIRTCAAVLALGQLAVMALLPVGFPQGAHIAQANWPWFLSYTAASFLEAALAWKARSLAYYVPVFAVLYAFALWWSFEGVGAFFIARTVAGVVAFGFMVAMAGVGAWTGGSALDAETRLLRAEAAARAEVEASVIERARLDGLVHDQVLAALQSAGQEGSDSKAVRDAVSQARSALTEVETPRQLRGSITGVEADALLRQQCESLDESTVVEVMPIAPGVRVSSAAVHVLQEVAAEAMRNSLQHAGSSGQSVTRKVTIRVDSSISVSVSDDGAGFSPSRIPPGRLGISVVMRGRIASLPGAELNISSEPGSGTVVTATVPAQLSAVEPISTPVAEPDSTTGRAAPDVLGLHSWAAATVAAAYLVAVAARPFQIVQTGLVNAWYLAAFAFLAAAVALLLIRGSDPMPRSAAWALAGCTLAAAVFNIEAVRAIGTVNQGLFWVWGAATVVLAFQTVRGRFVVAWAAQAGLIVIYFVAYARLNAALGGVFVSHLLWNLLLLGVCTLFARTLRRLISDVNETHTRSVTLAAERGRSQAQLRERDGLLRYLNATAVPLLERLAENPHTDADIRSRTLLLEARLRDRIRARAIATDPVLDAAEAARARGVEVALLDDGALDDVDGALKAQVQSSVLSHLEAIATGRLTARVMPPGRDALCTIVRSNGGQDVFTKIPAPEPVR